MLRVSTDIELLSNPLCNEFPRSPSPHSPHPGFVSSGESGVSSDGAAHRSAAGRVGRRDRLDRADPLVDRLAGSLILTPNGARCLSWFLNAQEASPRLAPAFGRMSGPGYLP